MFTILFIVRSIKKLSSHKIKQLLRVDSLENYNIRKLEILNTRRMQETGRSGIYSMATFVKYSFLKYFSRYNLVSRQLNSLKSSTDFDKKNGRTHIRVKSRNNKIINDLSSKM